MKRIVFGLETAVSVPIFVVSFLVSVAVVAARTGWKAASMSVIDKRALFDKVIGGGK